VANCASADSHRDRGGCKTTAVMLYEFLSIFDQHKFGLSVTEVLAQIRSKCNRGAQFYQLAVVPVS
jgi:hypothetical protein